MMSKSLVRSALDRSWSANLNWTKTWTRWKRKTTIHNDDKQNNVTLRRRNHDRKTSFDVKITYLNKREGEKW